MDVASPSDIDVAVLTKELEIAFAEQLVKCMAVVQSEFDAERAAMLQVQARSYEHLHAILDAKLATWQRDMEARVDAKLAAFLRAITQAHHDKMDEEIRSPSVVSDAPSSTMESAELDHLLCLSDGEGSQPVDDVCSERDDDSPRCFESSRRSSVAFGSPNAIRETMIILPQPRHEEHGNGATEQLSEAGSNLASSWMAPMTSALVMESPELGPVDLVKPLEETIVTTPPAVLEPTPSLLRDASELCEAQCHPTDGEESTIPSLPADAEALTNEAASVTVQDVDELTAVELHVTAHVLQKLQEHPQVSVTDCLTDVTLPSHDEIAAHISALAHGLECIGFGCYDSLLVLSASPLRTLCLVLAAWTVGGRVEFWLSGQLALPPQTSALRPTYACVDHMEEGVHIKVLLPSIKVISLRDNIAKADFAYTNLVQPSMMATHGRSPCLSSDIAVVLHTHDAITQARNVHELSHEDIIAGLDATAAHCATLVCLSMQTPIGLLVGALSALVQGSRLCLLESTSVSGPVLSKLLLLHEPKRLVLTSMHVMHLAKVGEAIACVDVVDCVGTSVPTLPRALRSLHTASSKFQPLLRFRRVFCGPTTIYTASDPMPLPIAAPLVHSVGLPVSSSIVLRIQSMTTDEVLGPKQVGEMCVGEGDRQRLGVLAYVDAAQQLHLIGSKDGILKLGAEATTALEIEEVVASHPLVEDAVVTCRDGLRLVAYVKLAAATLTYSADALRSIHAYACKQIPTPKQFHRLVAVDSIPRDIMGHAYRALVLDDANALQHLDATQH